MRPTPAPYRRPLGARILPILAVVTAAALGSGGSSAALAAQETQEPDSGVVRVSGNGQAALDPDRGRITFAVETRAEEASVASRENAERMTAVLEAVRGAEVEGMELETFGYSLQPEYRTVTENGERARRLDGYRAVNNVGVRFSDLDAAGRILDVAIGAGANRIGGLSFYAEDNAEAQDEALRLAVERATREANVIASALGRTLGDPIDVQGGVETPRPAGEMLYRMDLAAAQAGPETPIEAGEVSVSARVSITFRLGPPR